MPTLVCTELISSRFTKQTVSQLPLTGDMEFSQQIVGQIVQCSIAQFASLPLSGKSQTPSGEFVLLGEKPDSVWRINSLNPNASFNPIDIDGIGEYPDLDPKGFQKLFGSVVVQAKGQEVGYGF
jgi:hypothetical protein